MNDLRSERHRGAGEDVLVAVVLWVLDAFFAIAALWLGLAKSDLNLYEPDPHASTGPAYAYLAVFAGLVMFSAFGLYRLGFRISVAAQGLASAGLLLFCAAGVYG
ncbi:hypothetical protein GCM10010331_79700 [Streptomyces xanthochromogenes]|uniref:hypothetical protein n=1 Tax=Streptomyces xanthochromogenes TaxID=67384 RepID=UPI001671DEBB|nr:hypothetical protein [Streptomyces xanthochromogenes]GHB80227.1 hypothetical protein GCM10010331_79700 [Streptomyces xanthochromogenes]